MKMEFCFLGGADTVGRMGMTMTTPSGDNMLIEYGMAPTKPPEYPLQAPRIKHAFLTHSHLDHCGMIPAICGRDRCELFTTPLTAEVGEIMMRDSLKIAKAEDYPLPYTTGDIERTIKAVVPFTFGDTIALDGFDVKLHSAGHVPGAAMFEIIGDTNTVYTGDIHTIDTRLVDGAKPVKCENLFIEGTYGGRLHPDRAQTEKEFIDKIDEVIDRGGTVLIPSFAIGRTQEIMILLKDLGYDMWVDGMGKAVTKLYMDYPEYLSNPKALKAARRKFTEVRTKNMRKDAARADVIVTTGGMLDGGPVLSYIKNIKDDPRNAIMLVGYQAEDTNGRMLLEQGMVMIDGEPVKIDCEILKYDFSAHADHNQIVEFIRGCQPENVIIMHSETREEFLKDLDGYNVILPGLNEKFTLEI